MATIIRHTDANQFLFRKKKFLFIFLLDSTKKLNFVWIIFLPQIGKI